MLTRESILLFNILLLIIKLIIPTDAAAKAHFNMSALEIGTEDQKVVDLDVFSEQGGQLPGLYLVDVYVNDQEFSHKRWMFKLINHKLTPSITVEDLNELGIDLSHSVKSLPKKEDTVITNVNDYFPSVNVDFEFDKLKLNFHIPQADFVNDFEKIARRKQWSDGIPALLVNYEINGDHTKSVHNEYTDSYYLNLKSGINLGAWRLRNNLDYRKDSSGDETANVVNTYLQRPITSIDSVLTIGDTYTSSDVNDGINMRGIQLASDDSMLPDSLQGFSPVIRGIARTHAKVTIKQNGYVIDQRYVPPGAFVINNISPVSTSGQLDVVVTESDGSTQKIYVPISTMPMMQREGHYRYSLSAGKYRSAQNNVNPALLTASVIKGISNLLTMYSGVTLSEKYKSFSFGVALGGGQWGALSLDNTLEKDKQLNVIKSGNAWRLRYAKDFLKTNTRLAISTSYYPKAKYNTFQEVVDYQNSSFTTRSNPKRKIQIDLSQPVFGLGSLFISAYQQIFEGSQSGTRGISAGFNSSFQDISYGISFSRNQSSPNYVDQQIALTVQIPFSHFLKRAWFDYGLVSSKDGSISQQSGISGTLLTDNNLSYRVRHSYDTPEEKSSGSLYADFKGSSGSVGAGYNYDKTSNQLIYNVSGGIVFHSQGVTLSQPLGDTIALVRAPGAAHVKIKNSSGIYTDWRGYAVIPTQIAYRKNTVALETKDLSQGVDIQVPVQSMIPIEGAVAAFDFSPHVGRRLLLQLHHQGNYVPFGATASLANRSEEASIVGDNGEVFLTAAPDEGKVIAQWGTGEQQSCNAKFDVKSLMKNKGNKSVIHAEADCV